MEFKLLLTVFGTVFLAELGDKTQLATMFFATSSSTSLLTVFVGASLAGILASAVGVLVGGAMADYIDLKYASYVAGTGFVLVGIWTIWQA